MVEPKGKAGAFQVKRATRESVREVLVTNVLRETELQTDESNFYKITGKEFASHRTVTHGWGGGEYVGPDGQATNAAENFFGIFKRGMRGTYTFCGEQHLQRYVAEFAFRYSNRSGLGISDGDGRKLLSRVSRASA